MRMNIYAIVLSFFIFSPMLAFSQSPVASLDSVKARTLHTIFPADCIYTGRFSQIKHVPALDISLNAEGQFVYDCERGLVWATNTPIQQANIYEKNGKSYLVDIENTVTKLKGRVHRELGKLLNKLIGGDVDYLYSHFDVSQQEEVFLLRPQKKRMAKFIESIHLSLRESVKFMPTEAHIVIHKTDGEILTLVVSDAKVFKVLSEEECDLQTSAGATACHLLMKNE